MRSFLKSFKLVRRLDLFGYPISLSFKKKTHHKTELGGLLTFLFLIFIIALSSYCILKLFNQDYKVNYKSISRSTDHYGSISLYGNNFMMAVKFDNDFFNNWDKPLLNVTLVRTTQFRSKNGITKRKIYIPLSLCQEKHFPGLETDFNRLNLTSALCPDINTNLTLEGKFEEDVFTYLNYEVKPCQDATKCQPNSKLQEVMTTTEKIRFSVYIINSFIDEFNVDNPITRGISSDIHFLIDPGKAVYRSADIFLSETNIQTEHGYLPSFFERISVLSNFTFENEIREQTVFYAQSNSNRNVADFYFRKSQIVITHQRSLGNLLTILSYLGGIWSSLLVFFFPILQEYNRNSFFNKLGNKIYNFPIQTKVRKMRMYAQNAFKLAMKADVEQENPLPPDPNNIYEFLVNKIKGYFHFDRKLKTNWFENLKLIVSSIAPCRKSPKIKLLKECKANLMQDLDLYNVLRRLHEFDKIKKLLFKESQIKILDFSPKPIIRIPSEEERGLVVSNNLNEEGLTPKGKVSTSRLFSMKINYDNPQIFIELLQTWESLKKNSSDNKINQDLCKLFVEEFSSMFDLTEEYIETFLIKNGKNNLKTKEDDENLGLCEENQDKIKYFG